MSNAGFTNFSVVDGQMVFTIADPITGVASAEDESILLKDDGAIRAHGTGVITFTRCHFFINKVVPANNWWAIQEAALSYNGASGSRAGVSSHFNLIDCSITFLSDVTVAVFLSEMQNTQIFSEGTATVRLYTQETVNLDDMHIDDISWELIGDPSASGDLRIENCGSGPTNFDSGRMDLPYIKEVNVPTSLNLGTGNSGNNEWGIWNPVAFNNQTVSMASANSKFFDGWTSCWAFTNRDTGAKVSGVTVKLSSDRSGAMTLLGTFTTDSNGQLVGTYDSRAFTTGSSVSRPVMYFPKNEADQAGSTYGNGAFKYDLVTILHAIEARAFGFQPPVGFSLGDTYAPTGPVGVINSDYTPNAFVNFVLNNLIDLTETNPATIAAYTDVGPTNKFYDMAHYAWYANDGYPVITRVGDQMVLDDIVLTLDATGSVYVAASLTAVTAKMVTCEFGATVTTGKVIVKNGTLLSGGTFACDVEIDNGSDGDTYTNIIASKIVHTGTGANTLTLDGANCNVTEIEVTGGAALTVTLTNGATAPTATETSGTITLIRNVTVTNANLIDGTRAQLYNVTKAAEIDNSVVSGGGGYSYTLDLLSAEADEGDTLQLNAVQTSGATAKDEYSESGIVTAGGLTLIGTQDDWNVYNGWLLDGSAITKFQADYIDDEVDIIIASNYELREFGAWWVYNLTTEAGIRDFFGGTTLEDDANIRINVPIVDIKLDNNTTTNVHQTDNRRLYRSDGARPVKEPTTAGGGVDVEWRAPVVIANSDSLTASLAAIYTDTQRVDGLIEDVGGDQLTTKALNQGPVANVSGLSTFDHTSNEVITDTASRTASKADVSGLSTFNHLADEVTTDAASRTASKADVSGLSTFDHTSNEVITDTASRTASKADVSGLSTFDHTSNEVITDTASRTASKADVSGLSTFNHLADEVTTDAASRTASKADVSALATTADLTTVNGGVQKASKLIPYNEEL